MFCRISSDYWIKLHYLMIIICHGTIPKFVTSDIYSLSCFCDRFMPQGRLNLKIKVWHYISNKFNHSPTIVFNYISFMKYDLFIKNRKMKMHIENQKPVGNRLSHSKCKKIEISRIDNFCKWKILKWFYLHKLFFNKILNTYFINLSKVASVSRFFKNMLKTIEELVNQ